MIFSYYLYAKWRATCIGIQIPIVLQIQIPVHSPSDLASCCSLSPVERCMSEVAFKS